MEDTLIILKPDAVKRKLIGKILSRIEEKGFDIMRLKMIQLDKDTCEEHYTHLKEKPFFNDILNFMTSSRVVVAVISGENVIEAMRNLVGSTNPLEASPGSIRGDLAFSTRQNIIHASDSKQTAKKEINRFFS